MKPKLEKKRRRNKFSFVNRKCRVCKKGHILAIGQYNLYYCDTCSANYHEQNGRLYLIKKEDENI